MRNKPVLLLASLTAAICALLLLPIRLPAAVVQWHALADDLEDLGHPFVFALLGMAIFRVMRHRWAYPSYRPTMLAFGASLLLGAGTEYLQSLTGRDGSWQDLLGDLLGCTSGVCLQLAMERPGHGGRRGTRPLLFAMAIVPALVAAAPLTWTVAAYAVRAHAAPLFWRQDSRLLHRFSHLQAGRYPGLVVSEPPPDWSGYRNLVVDVVNTRAVALELNVRVHDLQHDESYADRFNSGFRLAPGTATELRIPLAAVRDAPRHRAMDMTAIRGVAVFVTAPASRADFQVRSMYLEP